MSKLNESTNEPQTFLGRLAERIGMTAKATSVYSEPIERDGMTIVPVAKVSYGFGGGAGGGKGDQGEGEGSGGGGGVRVTPLGYIEMRNGTSTFKPIPDPTAIAAMVAAGGFAAMMLFRGIGKLVSATKENAGGSD